MSLPTDAAQMARDGGINTPKLGNNAFSTDKLFQIQQGQFIGRDNLQSGTGNVNATQTYPDISLTSALSAPFNATTAWRSLSAYLNQVKNTNISIAAQNFYVSNYSGPAVLGSFVGGVLHPNGKIYLAPHGTNTTVGIINPLDKSLTTILHGGTPPYHGAVFSPLTNFVYFLPDSGGKWMKMNPADNTFTQFATTFVGNGGVIGPNGKIYLAPQSSSTINVINPSNDTMSAIGTYTGGTNKFGSSVLAPNGRIYMFPADATLVLKIDPNTDTVGTATTISTGQYVAAQLAMNGKIYAFPSNYSSPTTSFVLCLDPSNDSLSTVATLIGPDTGEHNHFLASNGRIYILPRSGSIVGIFDPDTNNITTLVVSAFAGASNAYEGFIADQYGNAFSVNYGTNTKYVVTGLSNNNFNLNAASNPLLKSG